MLVFLAADAGFFVVESGDLSFASVVLADSLLLEDSLLDMSVAVVLLAFLTAVSVLALSDLLSVDFDALALTTVLSTTGLSG